MQLSLAYDANQTIANSLTGPIITFQKIWKDIWLHVL